MAPAPYTQNFIATPRLRASLRMRGTRPTLSLIERQPDSLRLGEIVESSVAVLATQAGLARSPPRQSNVGIAERIDPHGSGPHARGHAVNAPDVGAPNAGRQTVGRAIRDAQRVCLVIEGNDR